MASAIADRDAGRPDRASSSSNNGNGIDAAQHSHGLPDDDDESFHSAMSPGAATASVTTPPPPYWSNNGHGHGFNGHQRTPSDLSGSLPVGAITLRDNEELEDDDRNTACWAKSVEIVDHTVINGSATNIGAFVVWIIRVETLSVRTSPAHCLLPSVPVERR